MAYDKPEVSIGTQTDHQIDATYNTRKPFISGNRYAKNVSFTNNDLNGDTSDYVLIPGQLMAYDISVPEALIFVPPATATVAEQNLFGVNASDLPPIPNGETVKIDICIAGDVDEEFIEPADQLENIRGAAWSVIPVARKEQTEPVV